MLLRQRLTTSAPRRLRRGRTPVAVAAARERIKVGYVLGFDERTARILVVEADPELRGTFDLLLGASWNVTQAAAGLGIDRTNLHRKMRKYGIARR